MNDVTGLILAGGRGERMGGADKGWVVHEGRPLIVSVVERLASQVGALLISANRNVERYAALGTVVEDDTAQLHGEPFPGPLIGVLSGLRRARTEWVAIVPCDAPHLPLDLVKRLTGAASVAAASAACARVQSRLQPVFAVMRTDCTEHLVSAVGDGERAMHRWLLSVGVVPVDFDEVEAFANINTPAKAS
jgi:molybdenum cofactor guanylyltransferase